MISWSDQIQIQNGCNLKRDSCLKPKTGKTYKEPDFDPLLAIHRIKNVELTERMFKFPKNVTLRKSLTRISES